MKKFFAVVAVVSLLFLAACGTVEPDHDPENPVTSGTANLLESFEVAEFAGQPMVLNFWASWCPACTRMMPALQAAYEQFGEEVMFVAINLVGGRETRHSALTYLENNGLTFPVYFDADGTLRQIYGVTHLPTTVFLDSNGEVVHRQVGAMAQSALFAQIERMI